MPDYPSRCQHLKINGTQCGSPALRRNRFCFFHKRFQDEQIKVSADRARRGTATFVLPLLEDANSIQIALMQVMRLLLAQQIDHKTASLLLSALRTASTNLRRADFKPFVHEVVLDPREVANTPLGSNLWEDQDFEEEEDQEEVETDADRALAALKQVRKKKEEDAKWMRWAEMQYPDPRKSKASATVTSDGKAVVTASESANPTSEPPPPDPKKPASSSRPEEIRAEISDMVRKQLLPALSEKFPPAKEREDDKEPEKKAT
jgi:hypothetical protein